MPETLTLVQRLKDFFKMNSKELMAEFKELSDIDREEFVEMFNDIGLPTIRKKS